MAKTAAPVDLRMLHDAIVRAKGGTFGAVNVGSASPASLSRRIYGRLLRVRGVGALARRSVALARRVRAGRARR